MNSENSLGEEIEFSRNQNPIYVPFDAIELRYNVKQMVAPNPNLRESAAFDAIEHLLTLNK